MWNMIRQYIGEPVRIPRGSLTACDIFQDTPRYCIDEAYRSMANEERRDNYEG